MIGAYYLSGRHFTYYDVNLKRNIYVIMMSTWNVIFTLFMTTDIIL